MPVRTPGELFRYHLSFAHSLEAQSLRLLPVLNRCTDNPQIGQFITIHTAETERQRRRLEQCFRDAGLEPLSIMVQVTAGLERDLELFLEQDPSQEMLDLFCLGFLAHLEHLEVSAYQSLLNMAEVMGEASCLATLSDTLQEEEMALEQVNRLALRLSVDVIQRVPPQ
jgi:ferritin-like metal-binding protein YciE